MGLLSRIVSRVLVGSVFVSLAALLMSMASLVRVFPWLLRLGHRLLRGLLILSYRLYNLILSSMRDFVLQAVRLDVLIGYPRLAMCLLLSVTVGLVVIMLTNTALVGWVLGCCALHGLFVGLAWDDIENPGGIRLGRRLE